MAMAMSTLLLLLLLFYISLFISSISISTSTNPTTILFTTLGRSRYAFDIYSTSLTTTTTPFSELRLTDGVSVNYNGFFPSAPTSSLLYVSERNGSVNLYLTPVIPSSDNSRRESLEVNPLVNSPLLSWDPLSMKDRPTLTGSRLIYISTSGPTSSPRSSWAAVYSTDITDGVTRRLTPSDTADFSPAVSPSGEWTAVASYSPGPTAGWSGEVEELNTGIYIFNSNDGTHRSLVVPHGGWPCWADDSTLYFHRRDEDNWWGVYKARINIGDSGDVDVLSVDRITPPGFHAFTPAASPGAPGLIAIATRRPGSDFRHVEVIDTRYGENEYMEVTRKVRPSVHHYNPFLSPDGSQIGYHRCRGDGNGDGPMLLENIRSVAPEEFSLFRIDGSFPSVSHDGERVAFVGLPGLFVADSDGSGARREVFKGNVFPTAWDWKRKGVIYTSLGPEFADESTKVDVISVTLNDGDDILPVSVKKLTTGGENNAFPSPSPDGKWVVFRSGRSGHKNLYIMDAVEGEAGGIRRLTEGSWSDTMCNWSPDGEWIAFASDRDNPGSGSFAIYMVHPNGTGLRKVVHSGDGGRTNHPWFNHDSKTLVFTSDYAAVSAEPISNPHHYQPYGDIFTVDIDGSNIRRLTHNSYEDGTPTWTPFFLKPRDVSETLQGSGLCKFDDCHWLSIKASQSNIQPGSSC